MSDAVVDEWWFIQHLTPSPGGVPTWTDWRGLGHASIVDAQDRARLLLDTRPFLAGSLRIVRLTSTVEETF